MSAQTKSNQNSHSKINFRGRLPSLILGDNDEALSVSDETALSEILIHPNRSKKLKCFIALAAICVLAFSCSFIAMNLCIFKQQTNNKSIEIFCEEFVLFVENSSLYVKLNLRRFLDFSSMELLVFLEFLKNVFCQIQTNLNQIQIKSKIFLNGLFDVDYLSLFIGYIEDFLKYLKNSKDSSRNLFIDPKVEIALESIKNTLINEKNIRDHATKNIKLFKMLNESLSEEYAGSQNTYKYLSYELLFTQSFDHGLPQPFNFPTRTCNIKVIFLSILKKSDLITLQIS